MNLWRRFFTKRASDLEEEIEAHLRMAERDRVARGESPAERRLLAVTRGDLVFYRFRGDSR